MGLSNEQIAKRLFVPETTMRTHLRNINVKLDAHNRMEAISVARRAGLIGLSETGALDSGECAADRVWSF